MFLFSVPFQNHEYNKFVCVRVCDLCVYIHTETPQVAIKAVY